MTAFLADLRHAFRTLGRAPAFCTTAILALAIGIGANVAVFSAVDALLLRPLQFRDSARLVAVWEDGRSIGFPQNTPAPGNFADWKIRNRVFEDMAALQSDIYAITGDGPPEEVEGSPVTANLFPLLGVEPEMGRNFLPEEDRPEGPKVALISFGLWQRRYGANRSIVGSGIRLNGETFQILGVMPRGLSFPERTDVWVPIAFRKDQLIARDNHYLRVYARLKPGVTVEQAGREMSGIADQLAYEHPESNTNVGAVVVGLRQQLMGSTKLGLWVLSFGVGGVLLIACANVAGLLLARAAGREREMVLRAALGAGRLRLLRQGMAEAALLAAAGGAAGVLAAVWSIPFLARLVPQSMAGWSQPQLDWRLLLFTASITTAATLAFGALPALTLAGVDLTGSLQSGGHGGIGGRAGARRALVVAETVIAMILCFGAGLLIETLRNLERVDLGFRPADILTLRTQLPWGPGSPYNTFAARAAFYQNVLRKVRAIPGMISAGYTTYLPLTIRGGTSGFTIEGASPPSPGHPNDANHRVVSYDYLQTIGVRLRAGRYFSEFDGPSALPVAIVNEAMARRYWPGQDAIGHRFKLGRSGAWLTIVGIVDNVRQMGIDVEGRAEMYFPASQPAASYGYYSPRDLAIRVKGDPMRYVSAARQAVWDVDRGQPVADVQPMTKLVTDDLAVRQVEMRLLSIFAVLALLLSAIGLYGLLAYTVTQRTREIGVRLALGARPLQIFGMVLNEGLRLVILGLLLGAAGGWALMRALQKLLYGVGSTDPAVFTAATLMLLVAGLAACYLPARRAASTPPMVALHHE